MREITNRQQEILDYIAEFIRTQRYSPSVRDVSAHFQISVKAAHDHIKALEKKQYLKTSRGISRSIELMGSEEEEHTVENIQVPMLGTIAAGKPLLSEENVSYNMDIPTSMLHGGLHEYFALKVQGVSMIDDGIQDGDIAILQHCETAERGDIVAASVEDDDHGGITLKEYYPNRDYVELRPANDTMGPIITKACHIHGKLVLLMRNY